MLIVRPAKPDDVPVIFDLIGELADYERLRPEMVGSIEDLRRHLFGQPQFAQALIAQWDTTVAGFAPVSYTHLTLPTNREV